LDQKSLHPAEHGRLTARILRSLQDWAGGRESLADYLGVPADQISRWIVSEATLPPVIFEQVVQLLLRQRDGKPFMPR
jgi:hypothetical protein